MKSDDSKVVVGCDGKADKGTTLVMQRCSGAVGEDKSPLETAKTETKSRKLNRNIFLSEILNFSAHSVLFKVRFFLRGNP